MTRSLYFPTVISFNVRHTYRALLLQFIEFRKKGYVIERIILNKRSIKSIEIRATFLKHSYFSTPYFGGETCGFLASRKRWSLYLTYRLLSWPRHYTINMHAYTYDRWQLSRNTKNGLARERERERPVWIKATTHVRNFLANRTET